MYRGRGKILRELWVSGLELRNGTSKSALGCFNLAIPYGSFVFELSAIPKVNDVLSERLAFLSGVGDGLEFTQPDNFFSFNRFVEISIGANIFCGDALL